MSHRMLTRRSLVCLFNENMLMVLMFLERIFSLRIWAAYITRPVVSVQQSMPVFAGGLTMRVTVTCRR